MSIQVVNIETKFRFYNKLTINTRLRNGKNVSLKQNLKQSRSWKYQQIIDASPQGYSCHDRIKLSKEKNGWQNGNWK